ncbi:MAG: dynamin, partial [Chloroflexota bacterium]|nr:dynamin [Chloroflexota bacterium]
VVTNVPKQIERKVDALIDWLVDANLRQWQSVTEHITNRREKHKDRMVGDIGSFHYDRERLIAGISREAKEAIDTYDKTREASQIAQGAQNAVAATAALEVGAIGLGTVITIIATTVAADVTGILLASLVAALGLFVIPARRKNAKKEMRTKVFGMRTQLIDALRTHFEAEINRSLQNIHETIAPYTRFVRSERDKNQSSLSTCQDLGLELEQLKGLVIRRLGD